MITFLFYSKKKVISIHHIVVQRCPLRDPLTLLLNHCKRWKKQKRREKKVEDSERGKVSFILPLLWKWMAKPVVKSSHDCVWRSVYFKKEGQQRKGTRGKNGFVHWCFLLYWAEPCCQSSSHLLLLSLSSCTHPSALYQKFFHRASAVWFQNFAIRKVIKGYTQCLRACFRHGFVSSPTERERERESVGVTQWKRTVSTNVPLAWFALTPAFNSK